MVNKTIPYTYNFGQDPGMRYGHRTCTIPQKWLKVYPLLNVIEHG